MMVIMMIVMMLTVMGMVVVTDITDVVMAEAW